MKYQKWAEPLHDSDAGRCDECDAAAVATIFEPFMDGSKAGQRRIGRLCAYSLSHHPEIYDTLYEDMCISGMMIESIKADFAKNQK